MIDSTIGNRYRIVSLLGAGGMGAVYEAIDGADGSTVAVKVVTAATGDGALLTRFQREARAINALDTPHIVRLLDAGSDDAGQPYLVMERLEGEDLAQLLKRLGPLPVALALRVTAQACLGLARAHAQRIVHRDIKPGNLYLARAPGGRRVVKILDFGIAKIKAEPGRDREETANLTRTGNMLGSPLYMSPEQARGLKDIDYPADLWSLGIVLYKSLSGRAPHQDTDALGELIVNICTEAPESIQNLAPWVPPEVAAIVHGALRLDPTERFASAEDMLAEIDALLPDGREITEAMLVGLTDEQRARVAPIHPIALDAPPPRPSRAQRREATPAGSAAPTSTSGTYPATASSPAATAPGGGIGKLVVGAVLAASVGGALAYQLLRPAAPSTAALGGLPSAAALVSAPAPHEATAIPSAAGAPSASALTAAEPSAPKPKPATLGQRPRPAAPPPKPTAPPDIRVNR